MLTYINLPQIEASINRAKRSSANSLDRAHF